MQATITNRRHRSNGQASSELLDRPPPQNLDAERDVLGSLLLLPDLCDKVAQILKPVDFYSKAHGAIFAAMLSLHEQGKRLDATLLVEKLKDDQELEEIGGKAYIAELVHAVPTAANAEFYAQIVRDKRLRRLGIHAAASALQGFYDERTDPQSVIESLANATRETFGKKRESRFALMSAAELCDLAEQPLDWIVPGLVIRHENLVISGVTKTCKTKLSAYLGFSIAGGSEFLGRPVYQNLPVLFGSMESGPPTIAKNLVAISEAEGRDFREFDNFHFVRRLPRLTIARQVDEFRRELEKASGGVAFYDPWYKISGLNPADSSNVHAAGERLDMLEELNREFEITPVLVAHNRKPGKLNDARRNFAPADLCDISGAGIAEWARSWILPSPRKAYAHDGIHELWLTVGGSTGASDLLHIVINEGNRNLDEPLKWSYTLTSAREAQETAKAESEALAEEKAAIQLEADRKQVLAQMAKVGRGFKQDVRERVRISGNRFTAAWVACVDDREIVEVAKEKAGNNRMTPVFCLQGESKNGQQDNNRTQQD